MDFLSFLSFCILVIPFQVWVFCITKRVFKYMDDINNGVKINELVDVIKSTYDTITTNISTDTLLSSICNIINTSIAKNNPES